MKTAILVVNVVLAVVLATICLYRWPLIVVPLIFVVSVAYFPFCFSVGKEGTGRVILRMGGYFKTLLVKKGYKLDSKENLVELKPNEPSDYPEWMGGLRFVSFLKPLGIDTVLSRDMKFQKSVANGVEDRDSLNVKDFLMGVDYPYAVPFVDCYDINNIPVNGHATMVAYVENLYKSTYMTTNFYDQAIGLVLPAVRECFKVEYSFTEAHPEKKLGLQDLDMMLWDYLGNPKKNPQPGSGMSVINELRERYAFVVVAFRVALIKPPPEIVEDATKKWKAEMDKAAAPALADAEFERIFGPVERAKRAGIGEPASVELRSQALAGSNFSYSKQKIDVTSADERIDPNVAGLIGGAKAFLTGGQQGKQGRKGNQGQGGQQGKQNQGGASNRGQPDPDDVRAADAEFQKSGKYPKWDPLKRTPN